MVYIVSNNFFSGHNTYQTSHLFEDIDNLGVVKFVVREIKDTDSLTLGEMFDVVGRRESVVGDLESVQLRQTDWHGQEQAEVMTSTRS